MKSLKKGTIVEKGRIGIKGQVVIPVRIRQRHNLKNRSEVCFVDKGDHIEIIPVTDDYYATLPDRTSTGGELWEEFLKYKREEKRREK